MNAKFSCADFTFPEATHDQALGIIQLLGFQGVDLGIFEDRSHHVPSSLSQDPQPAAKQMQERLHRYGLEASDVFVQFGPEPPVASVNDPDPGTRKQTREQFLGMVEFAVALGARHMTGLPGVWHSDESDRSEWDRAVAETAWRKSEAAKGGIVYAFEPHVGSLCPDPESALKFSDESETSITLDYGHFIYQGMDNASIHPLVARASHFHARAGAPGHLQCPVNENRIDFPGALKALSATNYAGWVCMEYVYVDWEGCNRTDNVSETLKMKKLMEAILETS